MRQGKALSKHEDTSCQDVSRTSARIETATEDARNDEKRVRTRVSETKAGPAERLLIPLEIHRL